MIQIILNTELLISAKYLYLYNNNIQMQNRPSNMNLLKFHLGNLNQLYQPKKQIQQIVKIEIPELANQQVYKVQNQEDWVDESEHQQVDNQYLQYQYEHQYSQQSQHLQDEDLQLLQMFSYDDMKQRIEAEEQEECVICFYEYKNTSEKSIRQLPCGHFYHSECVDKWLKEKIKCPTCKYDLRDYL